MPAFEVMYNFFSMASSKTLTDDELRRILEDPKFFESDEESDAESAAFIPSDHETTSEISSESENSETGNENNDVPLDDRCFYGKKHCYKWSKEAPKITRTRAHNLVIRIPGNKNEAKNIGTSNILSAWQLFITEDFLQIILINTNIKINEKKNNYGTPHPSYIKPLDMIELRAFIGLLYLSGIMKSNHENVEGLFANNGTGRDIFRATMSVQRFLFILSCLRFDNAATREARKVNDKLAAIRELWELFINSCQKYYTPGQNVTIDEMLVPFRGRCSFRMYMPKKPAKYGLKIMCICDSRTFYLCNAFVYTGKDTEREKTLSIPTQDVLKLITPVEGTNRNITVDNWFMSIELCDQMKDKKLTVLGTLKQNKPQIPGEFKPNRKRLVKSALFGHNQDKTICSYVPRKNRAVLLLSTMHQDQRRTGENNIPDMILDYNNTKAGVDALDQLCANYSVSRRTRRWPMVIFYAILNITGVNARIILQCNKNIDSVDDTTRRNLLQNLGIALVQPHIERRDVRPLSRELREVVLKCGGTPLPSTSSESEPTRKARCYFCPRQADKKTKMVCEKCDKHICPTHRKSVCQNCL